MAANSDIPRGLNDPETDLKKTFLTTFEVLLTMKEFGVKQLVFASTSAIYGELDVPLTEDVGPLRPISLYGAGKLGAEAFVSAFSACFGIQAWVFRFPNVVGERATHGAMFDFINKLEANPSELVVLGDGSQSKPYVYVKDLVAGILYGWATSATRSIASTSGWRPPRRSGRSPRSSAKRWGSTVRRSDTPAAIAAGSATSPISATT